MPRKYKVEGYWWLPGAPNNHVAGTLTFGQGICPKLNLFGSFEDDLVALQRLGTAGNVYRSEVIVGVAQNGKEYTLFHSMHMGGHYRNGLLTTIFRPSIVLEGAIFPTIDVHFASISLRLSQLKFWYGRTGKTFTVDTADNTVRGISFSYRKLEPVRTEFEHAIMEIGHDLSVDFGLRCGPFKLDESVAVYLRPEKPVSIVEFLDTWLPPIRDFFVLCLGKPLAIQSLTANLFDLDMQPSAEEPSQRRSVCVYWNTKRYEDENEFLPSNHMIATYDDISDDFQTLFRRWIGLYRELKPALEVYFGKVITRDPFSFNTFQNTLQAFEALHRRTRTGTESCTEAHATRIESIIRSAPVEHRDWLTKRLEHSNEKNLRARIVEGLSEHTALFEFSRKDVRRHAHMIAEMRNYHAHLPADRKTECIASGRKLYTMYQLIQWVLTACVFEEMGLEREKVHSLIRRNQDFILFKNVHLNNRVLRCLTVQTTPASENPALPTADKQQTG